MAGVGSDDRRGSPGAPGWDVTHHQWRPYTVAMGTDWWTAFYPPDLPVHHAGNDRNLEDTEPLHELPQGPVERLGEREPPQLVGILAVESRTLTLQPCQWRVA